MNTTRKDLSLGSTLSDFEVIERIILGEKELYEILMRRNNQKLFRVVRSYVKNEEEVQDIMQSTYLKAYEKLTQFKFKSQFSTWLIRIGINEALVSIKRESRIMNLFEVNHQNNLLETPDASQLNPESKMVQLEHKQLLELTIDGLPVKYKTVYILKEIEGMSVAEIALCLSLSPSNVKVRHFRAKKMIKEQLYKTAQLQNLFEFGFGKCDRLVELVMKKI